MNKPTQAEMHDYMVTLLKIWERTPSHESALFNDERISANIPWASGKVRSVREECSSCGWINYSHEGSKDYTLTPAGLELARGARRKQLLSRPDPAQPRS